GADPAESIAAMSNLFRRTALLRELSCGSRVSRREAMILDPFLAIGTVDPGPSAALNGEPSKRVQARGSSAMKHRAKTQGWHGTADLSTTDRKLSFDGHPFAPVPGTYAGIDPLALTPWTIADSGELDVRSIRGL